MNLHSSRAHSRFQELRVREELQGQKEAPRGHSYLHLDVNEGANESESVNQSVGDESEVWFLSTSTSLTVGLDIRACIRIRVDVGARRNNGGAAVALVIGVDGVAGVVGDEIGCLGVAVAVVAGRWPSKGLQHLVINL